MALIYVVEDDVSIREIEMIALKNSNYQVCGFERASDFFKRMEDVLPDLVLLDIMLPDQNGYEIVRRLRRDSKTARIPVIMVTAKTAEIDLVKGLDDGADDFIRKPFSVMELLSRVKALLRRTQEEAPRLLSVGGISMDHDKHTVTAAGQPVELTYKEYELLRYLMINANVVLSVNPLCSMRGVPIMKERAAQSICTSKHSGRSWANAAAASVLSGMSAM